MRLPVTVTRVTRVFGWSKQTIKPATAHLSCCFSVVSLRYVCFANYCKVFATTVYFASIVVLFLSAVTVVWL